MKKVTIIIVNYNGWADTIECLESVFSNVYPDFRVIVVDNNSSDGSLARIRAWAEGGQLAVVPDGSPLKRLSTPPVEKPILYVEYDRIAAEAGGDLHVPARLVLIRSDENKGFAAGNNIAIRYVQARDDSGYFWLLNNDTATDRNALQEMVKLAEGDQAIGMVGSKLLFYHIPDRIQTLGGTDSLSWNGLGRDVHPDEVDRPEFDQSFKINGYIGGASLLVRREVIDRIGLMDESYFMLVEESDWCLRCVRAGWRLQYCGKSRVWHKIGASSGASHGMRGSRQRSVPLKQFIITGYYGTRNHIYFMKKHFGSKLALSLMHLLPVLVRRIAGIIIFDDQKIRRTGLMLQGLFDGLLGRMGKTIDPVPGNVRESESLRFR